MEDIGLIASSVFIVAAFIMLVYAMNNKLGPSLKSYRFSKEGIDIFMFGGKVRAVRILRHNIRDAKVVSVFAVRLRSPLAFDWSNRLTTSVLLVRTTGFAAYVLSPADPEDALNALELCSDS